MQRRGFLRSVIAAAIAPALPAVKAASVPASVAGLVFPSSSSACYASVWWNASADDEWINDPRLFGYHPFRPGTSQGALT